MPAGCCDDRPAASPRMPWSVLGPVGAGRPETMQYVCTPSTIIDPCQPSADSGAHVPNPLPWDAADAGGAHRNTPATTRRAHTSAQSERRRRRGRVAGTRDIAASFRRVSVRRSCGAGGCVEAAGPVDGENAFRRSEEHTSELQSLLRISYDVFCLKKNKKHIR